MIKHTMTCKGISTVSKEVFNDLCKIKLRNVKPVVNASTSAPGTKVMTSYGRKARLGQLHGKYTKILL